MTTQVEQLTITKAGEMRVGMLRRILQPFRKVIGGLREALSFKAENIFKSKEWPYY